MSEKKPIHAKPSLYAYYFQELKEIALKYGYNLVLHGSLNRDLDLIAIPWQPELKDHLAMIEEFAEYLGGIIEWQHLGGKLYPHGVMYHGRINYIINLNRGGKRTNYEDPQYYLDISVTPIGTKMGPNGAMTLEQEKEYVKKHFEQTDNLQP